MIPAYAFDSHAAQDVVPDMAANAARAARAERMRLAMLARDLVRGDDLRIDEARRTRMRAMLDDLVRTIEGRLRRDLGRRLEPVVPADLLRTLGDRTVPIARPLLGYAGTLADAELVAVLARRVDEHRLVTQARIAATQDPALVAHALFADMLAHRDGDLAAAAGMVSTLAAARFGPFGEPALDVSDLPDAVRQRLVWRVAAAIRHWIGRQPDGADATTDRVLAAAAAAMLADMAMQPGLDDAALLLARAMLHAGLADDDATVALAAEGQIAVAVAGLALRVGIGMPAAWDMVLNPDGAGLVLLLRAAGLARPAAAALLLRWPDGTTPVERIGERISGYDALPATAAHAAIDLHRLEPAYVAALHELDAGLARS